MKNYRCICKNNSYGKNCEFFECSQNCPRSKCGADKKCAESCEPGWAGKNCSTPICDKLSCPKSICKYFIKKACKLNRENIRICTCDKQSKTGEDCEINCHYKCVHGVCQIFNV